MSYLIDIESTTVTLAINSDVTQLLLYNETFVLFYKSYSEYLLINSSFLSCTLIINDTQKLCNFYINCYDNSAKKLPAILISSYYGIIFEFSNNCYDLVSEKKCLISSPLRGNVTFKSQYSYAPQAFLIPLMSDNVFYDFKPKQTIQPTPFFENNYSKFIVFSVYIGVTLFMLFTVFLTIYCMITYHTQLTLPQDMFFGINVNIVPEESQVSSTINWVDE